jgi:hypothetical protein
VIDHWLQESGNARKARETDERIWAERAQAILEGCTDQQAALILDPARRKSLRCPRRAGKTWTLASYATYLGEAFPGSRILIISLSLGSTKENYWRHATAGIETMNVRYGLNLKYNDTHLTWVHENGSRGILKGADSRADIERIRGATAEADLTVVDECKSFAPALLSELLLDVVKPGLMTRQGTLVLAGTPGLIPVGDFYNATCTGARVGKSSERYANVPYELRERSPFVDLEYAPALWSLHSWSIAENTKVPGQWEQALQDKAEAGWEDDHPTWRREYLGEWVTGSDGLVYAFAGLKSTGKVTWLPEVETSNPAGLPIEDGPWNLVIGVDFGFEDDFALVVAAYSETISELRHVWDYRCSHLNIAQQAEKIEEAIARYGQPVAIVGDAGALGKLVVESMNTMYGLPIIKAEKHEKFDHIELLNSDFHTGRVKVIPDSELDLELCGLQWDLSRESKDRLARTGRLREDSRCKNHLCDALLYLWRYSYHHFSRPRIEGPDAGTAEWHRLMDNAAAMRASETRYARRFTTDYDPRSRGQRPITREDAEWRRATLKIS